MNKSWYLGFFAVTLLVQSTVGGAPEREAGDNVLTADEKSAGIAPGQRHELVGRGVDLDDGQVVVRIDAD